MMIERTCCFTGHRKLPVKEIEAITYNLNLEIERHIKAGVTTFLSGGALGFDQMAAFLIISKKENGHNIYLNMVLPCKGQDDFWTAKEKQLYRQLLDAADSIEYVSEIYDKDCMKKRNRYLIDKSKYCICALLHERSGTGQTVRYGKEKNRHIINVAKSPHSKAGGEPLTSPLFTIE